MTLCLLTIIVPVALEDSMIDWLLENPLAEGFTSFPVSGHGASEQRLSLAEKVSGRSRRIMFQIHLDRAAADRILQQLKKDYANTDMHFMLYPLLDAGHLEQND